MLLQLFEQRLVIENGYQLKLSLSSMFSCCSGNQGETYYQIKKQGKDNSQVVEYVNAIQDLDANLLHDDTVRITKVKKSGFEEKIKKIQGNGEKFTDLEFPPTPSSIGNLEGVEAGWKRISQLVRKPTLFDNKIEPRDVIHSNVGDCYFLSAIAALAEDPKIIQNIFHDQKYNEEGIYKVTLRVNGLVEEVVVDDNIPVNQHGAPIFCQPNKTGEFWVLILEKALAKINGSYANIMQGTPSEVFKAVTYAPSDSHVFTDSQADKERTWNTIVSSAKRHYPICATAKDHLPNDVTLTASHTYTIIAASEVTTNDGKHIRVVKLRNPWTEVNWQGFCNLSDTNFWHNVVNNQQKRVLFEESIATYGIFCMSFEDFTHFFNLIHTSNLAGNKFVSEEMYVNKTASLFDLNIEKQGLYTLELNQSELVNHNEDDKNEEICRSTILIVKKINETQNPIYQFVNGTIRYNEKTVALAENLLPGHYIVYAKLDPTQKDKRIPQNTSLSIHSSSFSKLEPVRKDKYPDLLKKVFLHQAKEGQKTFYDNNRMWTASRLLFQQGGFAYFALGVSHESDKGFVVNFNEADFTSSHFKLKKNFKGRGNGQSFSVGPGEEQIILARVINQPVKSIKFPPPLEIKIEDL